MTLDDRGRSFGRFRVSLIIPTHGRREMLSGALVGALEQELDTGDFEILVVDNAPADPVQDIVAASSAEQRVEIRYLAEPRIGLHHARHRGARAARGEFLAFVDDDVLLPGGWLEAILEPFADPLVAAVGGPVEPVWEGEVPSWWRHFPDSFLSLLDLGGAPRRLTDPGEIYGCNMAIRRSTLFQLGGFPPDSLADPRLRWFRGDGETGLLRRALAEGFRLAYAPRARLRHRIPAARTTPAAMRRRGWKSGLSESYGHIRADAGRPGAWRRLVLRGIRAWVRSIRAALRARWPGRGDLRVRDGAEAARWYGYAGQHLRAAFRPRLRRELLRQTHLEDE